MVKKILNRIDCDGIAKSARSPSHLIGGQKANTRIPEVNTSGWVLNFTSLGGPPTHFKIISLKQFSEVKTVLRFYNRFADKLK